MAIKIIFLDQDGTLLDSNKRFSDANRAALEKAAERGIHIVPCTGRFFQGITPAVRDLPFVRYAVAVNGAQVYDREKDLVLHRCELLKEDAWKVYDVLEALPVIYDCFQDNFGWIDQKFYDIMDQYAMEVPAEFMRRMRHPLENFRQTIQERSKPVQKIQMFFKDMELRSRMLVELQERFPDLVVSSGIVNNIELNAGDAHKGAALLALCRHLNIDPSETMAFGDGLNDITMLRSAGIGIAMANAPQPIKDAADYITDTNDNDGVAQAIARFCLAE